METTVATEKKGDLHKKPELESWWDINEIISWDFNVALDYLEKNCKDIDDWFEYYWKPFKKVTIKLPKTNWFNWKELAFYAETWDWCCNGKSFKENNCKEYSFSRNDITNILNSIKKFLISVWVKPYEKVDTFDKKYEIDRAEICLKKLIWLEENESILNKKGYYRLKDKILSFWPNYYQLVSKKNGIEIEQWFYNYWDSWHNDIGKLLFKSRPNKENKK